MTKNPHAVYLGRLGGLQSRRKLTSLQVLAIYESPLTYRQLAEAYGISQVTVGNIKRGRSWRWLTGCPAEDRPITEVKIHE